MKKKHQKYAILLLERVIEEIELMGKVNLPTINRIQEFKWKMKARHQGLR